MNKFNILSGDTNDGLIMPNTSVKGISFLLKK